MASSLAALPCPPAADASFGPQVSPACRQFDFTLLFEESILRLGPAALFVVLAPARIARLARLARLAHQPRHTAAGTLLFWTKVACAALFVVVQVALVALAGHNRSTAAPVLLHHMSAASSAVLLLASLALSALSVLEHLATVRPSTLITIYLLVATVFEAAHVRTLWLVSAPLAVSILTTIGLGVRIAVLVCESHTKPLAPSLGPEDHSKRPLGREETAGILARSLYLWLLALLRLGYSNVLTLGDLFWLESSFVAEDWTARFEENWAKANQKKSGSLFLAIVQTVKWHFLLPVVPRLCQIAFTFAQPFMLSRVLAYLASENTAETKSIGYGLIGAYALVYGGIAFATSWYQYLLYRFITLVRGVLVSVIYSQALRVSLSAASDSHAVTLMSTDVERVVTGLQGIHEVWATVLQVALAAWLLHSRLGTPFFLPILLCFFCAFAAAGFAVLAGKRQVRWLEAIKARLGATSALLKAIKGVKMSGMSQRLQDTVQSLRSAEIAAASQYRILMSLVIAVAFMPQTLAPVITFGAVPGLSHSQYALAAGRLFSSLLLLKLLTAPLTQLFQAGPILMSAVECVGRIQTFACSQKREDRRQLLGEAEAVFSETKTAATQNGAGLGTGSANNTNTGSAAAIRVLGGSFGWSEDDAAAVVKDVSLSFAAGQLTILVGPAGSGKSTLLKALLCETLRHEGVVQVASRHMGYCDQTPWLMNGTVQQNILGAGTWDQAWYQTVVHACALDEDFAALDRGDQAGLGSNGTNLSGGQKQRVAIARAVYARHRMLLLDDVLSGLDRKTEHALFGRLLSKDGLLRKSGRTVILAIHSVHLLPMADHIMALDAQGRVSEQGTFHELAGQSGYVSSLDVHAQDPNAADDIVEEEQQPSAEPTTQSPYSLGPKRGDMAEPASDAATRQTGDLAVYLYYFRASKLRNVAIYFGLQLAWAALGNFPTVWLQWWSNAMDGPNPRNGYYFGGYTGLQFGYLVVLCLLCAQVLLNMQVVSGKKLHSVLLTAAIGAPMSFFSVTDTGSLLNIFSQDLQILDSELPFALQNTVASALASLAQAVLLILASYWMALTYPFLIAAFYLVQRFYLRTSRQLRLLDLEAKSPLYTTFLESLDGLATIRAFGWQDDFVRVNLHLLDQSQKPFYLLYCVQRWLTLVLDLVVAGLAVVLMALSTQLRGSNPSGFTAVSLFNLANLAQTMTTTVTTWTLTEVAMGAVARIKTFQEETPSERSTTTPSPSLSGRDEEETRAHSRDRVSGGGGSPTPPPKDWPTSGNIEFRDVTAYYKDNTAKALDQLSLSIQGGEKMGICGRSGSGKNTFVQALFRMIDVAEGAIVIDGVDIASIPRESLREQLNAIPQEPFFLPGTFRDNVDLGRTASDDNIQTALQKVGLWATVTAAGGLDSPMSVDMLSHGQRQMFCLARAILRHSKVVVLDEATSSVDIDTDRTMQAIIRSAFADATVVAVAHRLNTILDFDRIAVLDKGRLIELDTPAALLARDSVFKELYEMFEKEEKDEEEEH